MRIVLITFFISCFLNLFGQEKIWLTNYNEALKSSKEKNIPILISFSGSDWCKPCMMLSKTIFETERFYAFAKDSLILLNLDFPRRNKSGESKKEIEIKEALAEKYNKKGRFPLVILTDQNGEVLGETGYKKFSVNEYIDHIKSLLVDFYTKSHLIKKKNTLYEEERLCMGSTFKIAVLHEDENFALKVIDSAYKEIKRIEKLISSWDKNSETSKINNNAGIKSVVVSSELFKLIKRSKKISFITEGAFDISFASMNNIWKFNRQSMEMPSDESIQSSIKKVNYNNIILNDDEFSVYLKEEGMRISFGGIGKGYAANKVKALMISMGIKNGIVNAGGDLIAWGNGPNKKKWRVGIKDPKAESEFISWLEIANKAVVTSGDYERFVTINNIRHAHIIDPRNGYPSKGIKSVTVICPDAELADALATSVFVLGQYKGLTLINDMDNFECIIVNDEDEIITSNGIDLQLYNIETKAL